MTVTNAALFTRVATATVATIALVLGGALAANAAEQDGADAAPVVTTETAPAPSEAAPESTEPLPAEPEPTDPEPVHIPGTVTISGEAVVGQILSLTTDGFDDATTLAFRWTADGVEIDGATASELALTSALDGATIRAHVAATYEDDTTTTADSEPVGPIVTTTKPTISGIAMVGGTLTAQSGIWATGTALTYRWFANGTVIASATSSTYRPMAADAGKAITVAVSGTPHGFSGALEFTSDATPLVVAAGTATVSGTPITGNKLTAGQGSWAGGTTFSYQWLADGAAIAGATASTYTVGSGVSGKTISVRITAKRTGYATVTRDSAVTARVMLAPTPGISGTVAVGSKLTATGTWTTGAKLTYKWLADGKVISGATASTYTVPKTLAGKKISVTVSGSKSGHPSVTRTSAATAKVTTAGSTSLVGAAIVGSTLSIKNAGWATGTTYSYEWFVGGVKKSTSSTFKIPGTAQGASITVKVTAKRSGFASVVKAPAATLKVMAAGSVSVSGTTKVTSKLTAKPGTWTAGTKLTYTWYADGKKIAGTGSTLTLTAAHTGKKISVTVTGTKSGHTTVARSSAKTAAITYPGRTAPASYTSCPAWAPIKGNASSGIYHVPGGRYYARTNPEECFRTATDAVRAGYRASKV